MVAASALTLPAFAETADASAVTNLDLITNLQNKTASGAYTDVSFESGIFSGKIEKSKNEIRLAFDRLNLNSYADTGYLGFQIKLDKIPTNVRVYLNGYVPIAGTSNEHNVNCRTPGLINLDGAEANKYFWAYIPLSVFSEESGNCYCANQAHIEGKSYHQLPFGFESVYQVNIQPETEAGTVIEIKDFGIYNSNKIEIDGTEKFCHWRPIINGSVVAGNTIRTDTAYGQDATVNKVTYSDKNFLASGYTLDAENGCLTVKPNATNTYGLSFNITITNKVPLPQVIWSDSILRVKIAASNLPEYMFVGPTGTYTNTSGSEKTANAGGARPTGGIKLSEKTAVNGYIEVDIRLSDIFKGGYETNNCTKMSTINFIFFNTDTNKALSNIDIADIAVYGPKQAFKVTGLRITKDSTEVDSYAVADTLTLEADTTNTTSLTQSVKLIGAFYTGTTLTGVQVVDLQSAKNSGEATLTTTIIVPSDAANTTFKVMALDNLDDLTPLYKSASATQQATN